ncbi:hypothetical protein [uncultured Planktomarina sp.]|uniref:hypothetical protein n=1 Tax=uncultured Planktomarina sp. TaxID=1538529 RepID=UPI0032617EA9
MTDELPDHKKFGYAHAVEMDAIRAELISEGHKPGPFLQFAAIKVYQERHKNDPTYRERQEAARAKGEKWVSPAPRPAPPSFNRDELELILARFSGSNSEAGASIASKAQAMLGAE